MNKVAARITPLLAFAALVLTAIGARAQGAPTTPPAPPPLVVWTDTPWQALTVDMPPPANPSLSLKLVAARGGIATGLVVVSGAPGPVSAKAGDLKSADGILPVRLRYATRKRDLGPAAGFVIAGEQLDTSIDLGRSKYLDALSDTTVADEPTQPVWVTVDVPADAKPGAYQGTIAVQGKGVSVALSVADFVVPPLGERRLYVGAHQSPDSVAFRYGVAPWSDAHFTLLEPSLDLAGRIGTNIMYVPVIGHTYMGQRNGLIVFTRKGDTLVPDFTAFDRYLDQWIKRAGKPRLIVLNVWDTYLAGNSFWTRNYLAKRFPADKNAVELTVRRDDGTLEQVAIPLYDKSQDLWKAVVDGVLARTAKVGLAKYQVLLGQCTDVQATKDAVDCFKAIDPDLRWTAWTHGYGYGGGPKPGPYGGNGNRMGLMAYPDMRTNPLQGPGRCVPVLPGPDAVIVLDALRMYLMREGQADIQWRLTPDLSADAREHGYGPVGLDLWPLPPYVPTAKDRANRDFRQGGPWTLKLEYGPNLDRGQPGSCTVAGPTGALSTARLEGLAEGACEAEARLCIEMAVALRQLDAATAAPILVARYKGLDISGNTPLPAEWNDSLAALYGLAGKAQEILRDPALLAKVRLSLPKMPEGNSGQMAPKWFVFRYLVDNLPAADRAAFLLEIARSGSQLRGEAISLAAGIRPPVEGLSDWMIDRVKAGDGECARNLSVALGTEKAAAVMVDLSRAGNAAAIRQLGATIGAEKAVPVLVELLAGPTTVREAASALLVLKKNEAQAAAALAKYLPTVVGDSAEAGRALGAMDAFVGYADPAVRQALVPGLVAVLADAKATSANRRGAIDRLGRLKADAAPALADLRKVAAGTDKGLADAATAAIKAIDIPAEAPK